VKFIDIQELALLSELDAFIFSFHIRQGALMHPFTSYLHLMLNKSVLIFCGVH